MGTREGLSNDAPDALQAVANQVHAKVMGDDEIQAFMAAAFVDFHGPDEGNPDNIAMSEELYERFQARVWLRVIDLIMVGED